MKLSTNILILTTLLIFTSCKVIKSRVESNHSINNSKDSIVFIEKVKVDTFFAPTESVEVRIPIEVLKTDTVFKIRKGRASTVITSKSGVLSLNTQCDSLQKLILSTEKRIYTQKERIKELEKATEEQKVIIKKVPWYYKVIALFGSILTVWLLVKNLFKRYLNPISWK